MRLWVSLCLFTLPLWAVAGERVFEERFPAGHNGLLKVEIDRGTIDVTTVDEAFYSVKLVVSGDSEYVDEYQATFTPNADGLELIGRGPRKTSGWGWSWFGGGNKARVRLQVSVPRTTKVNLNTAGGNIEVEGTNAAATLRTSGGNVILSDAGENIVIKTSGGNITLTNTRDNHELRTSGGQISVTDAVGDFLAKTSGGDIELRNVRGPVNCATSGGNIDIELTDQFEGIRAKTSGGDIVVHANGNIAADLKASTSGGRVRLDMPVTLNGVIKPTRVEGTLNGGGERIHLSTSGGDIAIKEI